MQPCTTFAKGVNPFGAYKPPKPKTKERRPFMHLQNSAPAQRVLAHIRDNPGVFARDIRNTLPIRGIYGYIKALEDDGIVHTVLVRNNAKGPLVKRCYLTEGKTHGH